MRNRLLYGAGLTLGTVNKVRHLLLGYRNPRPFDPQLIGDTIRHVVGVVERLEERASLSWAGARVLEIGPGPDLATGVCCCKEAQLRTAPWTRSTIETWQTRRFTTSCARDGKAGGHREARLHARNVPRAS